MQKIIQKLESVLQYTFTDTTLLLMAMTHSSYAHERLEDTRFYNERLEFLGDAVLELAVSRMLYMTMSEQEGDLSKTRASIVCEPSLAYVARALDLGQFLRLSHGEEKNGGRERSSILSDFVEAIIGAIYLDGGYEPALSFIERELFTRLEEIHEHTGRDYKTDLQEKVQAQAETVRYDLIETAGPPHNRRFTMQAVVADKVLGQGIGKTKKEAEQQAAKAALEKL